MGIFHMKQQQNNFWDGVPRNKRMRSHLRSLKFNFNQIIPEGTPLDNFENNFLKEASFSWNPPIRSTLTAVGKNDIDVQLKIDDLIKSTHYDIDDSLEDAHPVAGNGTRNLKDVNILGNGLTASQGVAEKFLSHNNNLQNNNDDSFVVSLPAAGTEPMNLMDEIILANGDSPSKGDDEAILSNNNTTPSEDEIIQESASPQNTWILSGISKITE